MYRTGHLLITYLGKERMPRIALPLHFIDDDYYLISFSSLELPQESMYCMYVSVSNTIHTPYRMYGCMYVSMYVTCRTGLARGSQGRAGQKDRGGEGDEG